MALSQTYIPNSLFPFDAASKADLVMVKTFVDQMHANLNNNYKADGGSVEEFEANSIYGTTSIGFRYQPPRENYEYIDRLVITADAGDGREAYDEVDYQQNADESQAEATERWLNAGRTILLNDITTFGLTFASAIPPVVGPHYEPSLNEPVTQEDDDGEPITEPPPNMIVTPCPVPDLWPDRWDGPIDDVIEGYGITVTPPPIPANTAEPITAE